MQDLVHIRAADRSLLDEISAEMAEAVRRGPHWVACRPGCTECCIGPFAITQLDALRLREGLAALYAADPERARAVQSRAAACVAVIGELCDELPPETDNLPCPALNPETGLCDLYEARPITCRTFGPATRFAEQSIAACELCYVGATPEEIARCAVEIDPESLESQILATLESTGLGGPTLIAHALVPADGSLL
jgi:Fe-S-cluster containining protein